MEQNPLTLPPTQPPAPLPVTPSDTAATTLPSAQLQTTVDYMPNITVFGSKTMLLEWGADNHIRLFDMNFDTNQATGVMFDTDVKDIKKITGSLNVLTFHIGDQTYRTLFARMATAGAGVVGAVISMRELKASGSALWIKKLKENGVKVSIMGWGKAFIIAFLILAVVTAIVIIVQINNGTFDQ